MSLFNSQTIFSILVTLLIGAALYYYIKYKYRILELTQREQAKVLQSVIMSMNNNNHNLVSMIQGKSNEELVSESIAHDMNRFSEVNKTNELIDVSDDDSESESDDDSDSDSGSDSESGSDSGSEYESDGGNNNNNSTTKKILFTGNHESHLVEHLEGPDVKIIELSHPLYSKNDNDNEMYNKNANHNVDEDDDASSSNSDNDSESDSESVTSDMDGPHEPSEGHEIHEIKENTVTNEMNNQNDLETENISDNISEIVSVDSSLDNLLIKAVFKNKDSETHTDYNSMNVQSLRQLLKNKLASDGSNMSESSINKLTKKDLIKHLS